MEKPEIVAGIKNAVEKGYSLDLAVKSFINAGYNEQDVLDSAKSIGGILSQIEENHPSETEIQDMPLPSDRPKPQQPSLSTRPQQLPQPMKQPLPIKQPQLNNKPKNRKWLIILLIIILIILLVILAAFFIFKDKIIDLIKSLI